MILYHLLRTCVQNYTHFGILFLLFFNYVYHGTKYRICVLCPHGHFLPSKFIFYPKEGQFGAGGIVHEDFQIP